MVFLGTPFYGSRIAGWAEIVRRIYDVVQRTDAKTLKSLKIDSQDLRALRMGFPEAIRKRNQDSATIAIVFFFEKKTTYGKVRITLRYMMK